MDFEWFNKKYAEGRTPSLEDKASLFSQLNIPFPERAKEKIIHQLQTALHNLNREYTPANEILAHGILFCLAPILCLESSQYKEYLKLYNKAMEKHKDKSVFRHNFQQDS